MATVTCTPSECRVGQEVVVEGLDFAASTLATMTIESPNGNYGVQASEANTDSAGAVATVDQANYANATLTSSGVNVSVNDVVTIGAVTYTFKAAPTTVANEVLIGATAAASLQNLKDAINLTGVSGTTYGSGTVIHPTVRATTITATTLFLVAKTGGTGGNSLAFSKTAVTLSVSAANFANGAAATAIDPFHWIPSAPGVYTVRVTDGSATASTTIKVSQSS